MVMIDLVIDCHLQLCFCAFVMVFFVYLGRTARICSSGPCSLPRTPLSSGEGVLSCMFVISIVLLQLCYIAFSHFRCHDLFLVFGLVYDGCSAIVCLMELF